MKIKIYKYRIIKDDFSGYECQIWRIYFPFWLQLGGINTHNSIQKAEKYIEKHRLKKT